MAYYRRTRIQKQVQESTLELSVQHYRHSHLTLRIEQTKRLGDSVKQPRESGNSSYWRRQTATMAMLSALSLHHFTAAVGSRPATAKTMLLGQQPNLLIN